MYSGMLVFARVMDHLPLHQGAVRIHPMLDLQGCSPSFIHISDGKLHDVKVLDELPPEPGAIALMDRA